MSRFIFPVFFLILLACESSPVSTPLRHHGSSEDNPADEHVSVSQDSTYNVALLIMDGTFNTELTAPMDIFHHTKFRANVKSMNVFTIANTKNEITTFEGLTITPDYDYTANYPDIDILVIPAAEHNLDSDLKNTELLDFIRSVSTTAKFITSHCDGAFVLAKTGLLRNHVSTTFPGDIEAYRKMFPSLDVRDGVLFVHDGKYITSAGGAKSFEASLYLCEILYGKEIAEELAKGMVIDWDLESLKYVIIE